MVFLFVGYLVLWALTFGYLYILGSRQKQVQRDLETLLQERSGAESAASESL
jgi:CcmD family protein